MPPRDVAPQAASAVPVQPLAKQAGGDREYQIFENGTYIFKLSSSKATLRLGTMQTVRSPQGIEQKEIVGWRTIRRVDPRSAEGAQLRASDVSERKMRGHEYEHNGVHYGVYAQYKSRQEDGKKQLVGYRLREYIDSQKKYIDLYYSFFKCKDMK